MSTYTGDFADLYDLFYESKPYQDEAAVLDALIRSTGTGPHERLLDVACGTGRHAAAFANLGWSVVGVDASPDMVERARKQTLATAIEFVTQDMRTLNLPLRKFDAATCLFDSIGYAVTNDGVLASLRSIRDHLRVGGLLALEFWHAPAMLRGHEPVRYREWAVEGDTVIRVSETAIHATRQTAAVSYTIHRISATGAYHVWHEMHENRFFGVQEMSLLLDDAGFRAVRWLAGYDSHTEIDLTTWHVIVAAEATPDASR